ncbi:MAG: hypothetical protein AcusKO_37900 [Acuticoccus sp.]
MTTKPAWTFTGRHMLIVMVSFFGVVVAVNVAMAVMATRTFNGLVARNGYVASIDFVQDQKNRDRAATLGWQVAVGAGEGGDVRVGLTDTAGHPLTATVTGTVAPVLGATDPRPLAFAFEGDHYSAPAALTGGDWVVRLVVTRRGEALDWRHVVDVAR